MSATSEEDIAEHVLATAPERLHTVIDRACLETPDRPAVSDDRVSWTYGQLDAVVTDMSLALRDQGLRPGDRLMIIGENCNEVAALIFAASRSSAWAIVVNPRMSSREIAQIRSHSCARLAVFAARSSKEAAMHAEEAEARFCSTGPFAGLSLAAVDETVAAEPVFEDGAKQVAVLIYTSGTTGTPKGVMLSHQNLLYSAGVTSAVRGITAVDRIYGVLPVSHIVGISLLVMTFQNGASIRLSSKFDPAALIAAVSDEGVTMLSGVPATYQRVLEYMASIRLQHLDAGKLRFTGVSGAPLDINLKRRVEAVFGLPLLNGFGITECSPGISGVRIGAPRDDVSVGKLLPGIEARIVATKTDDGGDTGELHVRGPNVMLGYYKSPEQTSAVVDQDGWFNTGDLARFAEDALFVVGRTKEMIIRSGFNVYPAEVEAVLSSHPDVVQCAVVGRRTEDNEDVVAFVQFLAGSTLGIEQLAEHARSRLTAYKRPTEIIAMASLPATSTGKILKHKLAETLRA